jgi:hypothetical protein
MLQNPRGEWQLHAMRQGRNGVQSSLHSSAMHGIFLFEAGDAYDLSLSLQAAFNALLNCQ